MSSKETRTSGFDEYNTSAPDEIYELGKFYHDTSVGISHSKSDVDQLKTLKEEALDDMAKVLAGEIQQLGDDNLRISSILSNTYKSLINISAPNLYFDARKIFKELLIRTLCVLRAGKTPRNEGITQEEPIKHKISSRISQIVKAKIPRDLKDRVAGLVSKDFDPTSYKEELKKMVDTHYQASMAEYAAVNEGKGHEVMSLGQIQRVAYLEIRNYIANEIKQNGNSCATILQILKATDEVFVAGYHTNLNIKDLEDIIEFSQTTRTRFEQTCDDAGLEMPEEDRRRSTPPRESRHFSLPIPKNLQTKVLDLLG